MNHDVLVLGAGPAGISAACFLAQRGVRVAVVDPLGPGGRLVNVEEVHDDPTVAPGTMGWDLAVSLGEQALRAGVEVVFGQAERVAPGDTGGWTVWVDGAAHETRAVLVATGCRPAPLPGDEDGELLGRGVAYCAVCDGGMFAGQAVAVVGGGDIALAEVATLAASAAEVVLLCPEAAVTASRRRIADIEAMANVRALLQATLQEVVLDDGGRVRGVRYLNGADGRGGELAVAAVFGAHRELPNSAVLVGVAELDEEGFVRTDERHRCLGAAAGLFAAGEVRRGVAPYAASARGDAISAAAAIVEHLGSPPGAAR